MLENIRLPRPSQDLDVASGPSTEEMMTRIKDGELNQHHYDASLSDSSSDDSPTGAPLSSSAPVSDDGLEDEGVIISREDARRRQFTQDELELLKTDGIDDGTEGFKFNVKFKMV